MSLRIIKKIARINPYDDRIFKYFDWDLNSVPKEVLRIQYRKGEVKILAQKYDVKISIFNDRLHYIGIQLKGRSKAMRQYGLKGKEEPRRKNKKIIEIKQIHLEKTGIIQQNLEKRIDSEKKDRRREIDYQSYKELENIALLDDKDIDYAKEIVKIFIGEMHDDVVKGFSSLNGKKLSTKLIYSSLFRIIAELGYNLSEINTNDALYLESIAKSFLPEMREKFNRIREYYSISKKDRIRYMKDRLGTMSR